eukprot:jgi/Antlo1/1952/123
MQSCVTSVMGFTTRIRFPTMHLWIVALQKKSEVRLKDRPNSIKTDVMSLSPRTRSPMMEKKVDEKNSARNPLKNRNKKYLCISFN